MRIERAEKYIKGICYTLSRASMDLSLVSVLFDGHPFKFHVFLGGVDLVIPGYEEAIKVFRPSLFLHFLVISFQQPMRL